MIHHVAITASNFEISLEFYQKLGFQILVNHHIPEKQKKIALLQLNNFKLELFWYKDFIDQPEHRNTMGNNVKEVGAKHFAIQVESLEKTRDMLRRHAIEFASEPAIADTGYQFCFIKDPDSIWIEYVQDDAHR
jgi:catechol 2,3-dioxygenase-like lactoylglutathione lyase family enzyme